MECVFLNWMLYRVQRFKSLIVIKKCYSVLRTTKGFINTPIFSTSIYSFALWQTAW